MSYRLLSYQIAREARAGLLIGEQIYDAARVTKNPRWSSVLGALQDWAKASKAFDHASRRLAAGASRIKSMPRKKIKLLAPVLYPNNIYCAGANYVDHMHEMASARGDPPGPTMKDRGEKPWHFVKTSKSSIVGPNSVVKLPSFAKSIDWEVELVAVIGRTATNVSAEKALSYVAGWTIANDLSARDASRRANVPPTSPFHFDWISQKCWDGSCPVGPWIVPASEIRNPHNLALRLWVGDELMQDSNTNKMIFNTAEQIEMLSSRVTLHPGDLVLTGTPAGVGMARKRFLQSGETCKLWIEGIGELFHRMA